MSGEGETPHEKGKGIFKLVYSSGKPKKPEFTPGHLLRAKAGGLSGVPTPDADGQQALADSMRDERRRQETEKEVKQRTHEQLLKSLRLNREMIKEIILREINTPDHSRLYLFRGGTWSSTSGSGDPYIETVHGFIEDTQHILNIGEALRDVQTWLKEARPFGDYWVTAKTDIETTASPSIWLEWGSIMQKK